MALGSAVALPCGEAESQSAVKLGHWFTLRQSIRSNLADQRGELQFTGSGTANSSLLSAASPLSASPSPASSQLTYSTMSFVRPAVLPKGRMKRLDIRMLASLPNSESAANFQTQAIYTDANTRFDAGRVTHRLLRGDEYQFVILTRRPERFDRFRKSNWVRSWMGTNETTAEATSVNHYQLVIPKQSGVLDLPETALDWTSVAYVFWDDFSPANLTPTQTQALVDWLHFGGRLIINGTTILPELAASPINPLLPIQFEGLVELESESLASLINRHQVPKDTSTALTLALVQNLSSRIRIGGSLKPDAYGVDGTDELIVVQPVGRGEVILSGFDLTSDWTDGWRSYDSFMNHVILGRPGRRFDIASEDMFTQQFLDPQVSRSDVNSYLRLFSRDAVLGVATGALQASDTDDGPQADQFDDDESAEPQRLAAREFQSRPLSGYGAWSDSSSVAVWLQSKLKENAGVAIPNRDFVLKTISILILLITVVNYAVFRLLGRLEWAWFAIPIIGVMGAVYTSRAMRVDFGLGRNQNDVSLLELQPGYTRGHHTRFLSIYNSLSGEYELAFASPDACVAPVQVTNQVGLEPQSCRFQYSFDEGPSLSGFEVPSNRTRLVHAEQWLDVGGVIELKQDRLINRTRLQLDQCELLKRDVDGAVQWARVDQLSAGATVNVKWQSDAPENLSPLLPVDRLPAGSVRLVAKYDDTEDSLTVIPETNRNESANWLLAHLQHPLIKRGSGDANLPPKIRRRDPLEAEVIDVPASDIPPLEESPAS